MRTKSLPTMQIRGILASKLISSQGYQRPLSEKNVKAIKDGYVKELVNPVKVSLRNQKYFVFDGQHTLACLTELFGENAIIPCIIYTGLSYEQEAELFAKQDEFKKKLYFREQFKAKLEADDPKVREFVNIVTDCGFQCDTNGKKGRTGNRIAGIKYLYEDVFLKTGKNRVVQILSIIKGAWSGEKNATDANIIKGLDYFLTLYDGEVKTQDLIARLSNVSPVVIQRNAKADMTHTGNVMYAIQIFDTYNKGRRTKIRSKF